MFPEISSYHCDNQHQTASSHGLEGQSALPSLGQGFLQLLAGVTAKPVNILKDSRLSFYMSGCFRRVEVRWLWQYRIAL